MEIKDIQKKGFSERFHTDSKGRRWDFLQPGRVSTWQGKNKGLFWRCSDCGFVDPVVFTHIVHDEVIVPDPTEQLDAHDCDVERTRKVLES